MRPALTGIVASIFLLFVGPAVAEQWPTRPVKIIVPLAPGGGGDVFARIIAAEFQKKYGKPFVIENRGGGGQNIGTPACAEAAPDGYTLCQLSSEPAVYNQFLYRSLPFNPEKDFQPIANMFFNNEGLVAKQKSGTLSYATLSFTPSPFHGKSKKEARLRYGARAVPRRRRGGQRGFGWLDASSPARLQQYAGPIAKWRHHADSIEQQCCGHRSSRMCQLFLKRLANAIL
jgi:hypothetical protein